MANSKNTKIEKYHFEEIIFILLILASELSKYDDDDLISFSESIEGRIDVLYTKKFLVNLDEKYAITDELTNDLSDLRKLVLNLYEPQWHKKLNAIKDIRLKASKILNDLKIDYEEPKQFSEKHLNIDW